MSNFTLSDSTKESTDFIERRANTFAAAFLMPREGVAEQLQKAQDMQIEANICSRTESQTIAYQDAAVLAGHFGVSYKTAVWRLKNLYYINSREAAELAAKNDIGKAHIQIIEHELPFKITSSEACEWEIHSQLKHLSIEAFCQEEISRGRLVEIGRKLEIDSDEMLELAETTCPD